MKLKLVLLCVVLLLFVTACTITTNDCPMEAACLILVQP